MEPQKLGLGCLPSEIIESVLECDSISHADVCRISGTSRNFHNVAMSNRVWRAKYTLMWPDLAPLLDANKSDWKKEFIARYEFKTTLATKLKELSSNFYYETIDDAESGDKFINAIIDKIRPVCDFHPLGGHIMLNELRQIVKDKNESCNLSLKYYAKKALLFMQHINLKKEWKYFMSRNPPYHLILIEGLYLISRWFQFTQTDSVREVPSLINSLSQKVYHEMRKTSPGHPLIKKGILPPGEGIDRSLWIAFDCKSILNCINYVMFQEMEFSSYITYEHPHQICIDKVMGNKMGPSEIISIVYAIVAARLGVYLTLVGTPQKFSLRWLEHPERQLKEAYTFIDVYRNGNFRNPRFYPNSYPFAVDEPTKVLFDICFWIFKEMNTKHRRHCILQQRAALDLLRILRPDDHGLQNRLSDLYESIPGLPENHDVNYRTNEEDVKYAVGMIMEWEKSQSEIVRCVIYGWNVIYEPDLFDEGYQVYYFLLGDDELDFFTTEAEDLKCMQPDVLAEPIRNGEIGKYFESFHGTYYRPNEYKRRKYPDDEVVRERILGLR